jgi:DNA polymerase III subunit delta'
MSFAAFPTQPPSLQLLQRSLARGRVAHAYLLAGEAEGELEAVARTLAKTLNCRQPERRGATGTPVDSCDRCPSCVRIQAGNHPDVQWVRPESKSRVITIDQVRDLMQTVHLKATDAEYKVAVIVDADRLNIQAANAFLKTLEEPPDKSILILLSTDPQRLLETVRSRCLRLSFGDGVGERLDAAQRSWIGAFSQRAAEGQAGLLDRYQLLGLLQTRLSEVKEGIQKRLTAASPLARLDDVEPAWRDRWEAELSASIEAEYRRRRGEWLAALQVWLRDVWLRRLGLESVSPGFPELSVATRKVAERISMEQAQENLGVLEQTQRLLGSNVQEALTLEVGLLRLRL